MYFPTETSWQIRLTSTWSMFQYFFTANKWISTLCLKAFISKNRWRIFGGFLFKISFCPAADTVSLEIISQLYYFMRKAPWCILISSSHSTIFHPATDMVSLKIDITNHWREDTKFGVYWSFQERCVLLYCQQAAHIHQ